MTDQPEQQSPGNLDDTPLTTRTQPLVAQAPTPIYTANLSFDPHAWPVDASPPPKIRGPLFGIIAFSVAVLCLIGDIVAISLASTGAYLPATVIGQTVITVTIGSFIAGVVAFVIRRGRSWGMAAAILSFVGNPLVAVVVLGLFAA